MIRLTYDFDDEKFGNVYVDIGDKLPVQELSDEDLIEMFRNLDVNDVLYFLTLKKIETSNNRKIKL